MSEAGTFDEQKPHWITIPMDEYESMKSTLEILSNPQLRDEALKGKEQAQLGKTRKLDDVKKELCL